MDLIDTAFILAILAQLGIFATYTLKNSSPPFSKRPIIYGMFILLIAVFCLREMKSVLPESLGWLFFLNEMGDIYSIVNYVMVLAGLFGIGLLRSLQTSANVNSQQKMNVKVLKKGDNPFLVVFKKLKLKKVKKK